MFCTHSQLCYSRWGTPPIVRAGVGEHPAGSDAEEVVFVSAGGLMSRVLINNISIQSTKSRGTAVLNLQVPQ